MRNRESKMSCVKCNAWVLTEAEAQAQALGGPRVQEGLVETVEEKLSKGVDTSHSPPPSTLPAQMLKMGHRGRSLDRDGGRSLLPTDLAAALKEALVEKLWEAQKALKSASVRSHLFGTSI